MRDYKFLSSLPTWYLQNILPDHAALSAEERVTARAILAERHQPFKRRGKRHRHNRHERAPFKVSTQKSKAGQSPMPCPTGSGQSAAPHETDGDLVLK